MNQNMKYKITKKNEEKREGKMEEEKDIEGVSIAPFLYPCIRLNPPLL